MIKSRYEMNKPKEINIKNHIYYFNDLININNLRLVDIFIVKQFCNYLVIYHIRYQIKYSIN